MMGTPSLKRAILDGKIIFEDEIVKIASDPQTNINEAIFEVEFSNFLRGNAHQIYIDPVQFFRKTHFTEDMKNVLKRVLSRVTSVSDESYAIVLDTTFGGGKTHSLIAIYHLFKNRDVAINYQEIRQIMRELEIPAIPEVEIVAIDGHNIDPEENIWNVVGRLLGDGALASRTSPPTAAEIENAVKGVGKPVVFLIDELVVYISKILDKEAKVAQNKAFIHSLFVAVEATKTSIVVLTIPGKSRAYERESEILRDITAIAERGAAKLAPVAKEDIIRILKKRFVKSIDENYARKAAKFLHDLYVTKLGIGEAIKEDRLFECYPFSPELVEEIFFGRIGIYEDFQVTRGILKIMARVIVNLLRHADELPETTTFISAGEVDLSDPELMRKLADKIFGANLDQVVQTDIATAEGTAHAQEADGKVRFGNFVRISTAVYLYSLYPEEPKKGANSRQIFRALGDESLDPQTIDSYLEKLYDEIATHIFRAEGTDRYYFKTEENPRALVRNSARDVKEEEVKLHLQKEMIKKIIPSTDVISADKIFEKEIKRDNTDAGKLNIFLIDYEDVFRLYSELKRSKEYESEPEEVVAGEVYNRIFSNMLSITTPNRNSVVLIFPVPWEITSFKTDVKELIACEKLKKERSKDKEFLKELKAIQERIYAKTAQKLINLYSYVGFFQRNEHIVRQLSPITYDEKAKYTERIFEELERKWSKVLSSVSVEYLNGVMGMEKKYMKFSELVNTIANSTSYPFVPAKYLRQSIREMVKNGDVALYRGEICEPDEVDLAKSEEIIRNLKYKSEIQEIRDSDYILKKDFAEELLEAAERKRADKIAQRILDMLGDANYAEISWIESEIPELSRKDIVDAIMKSQKLKLYGGDIALIKKFEEGVELSDAEKEEILTGFSREDGDYVFKTEYFEEIKRKLEVTPPPSPEGEEIDVKDLIEKFDEYRGRRVTLLKVSGKGELKEDSLSISGAVSFLNLRGKIKVDVKGGVVFRCESSLEKIGVLGEILKKISELDPSLEYIMELNVETEINDDFRIFAEELMGTKSEKVLWVE